MTNVSTGLGLNPAIIPVGIAVAKNAYGYFSRLFGGKLVWGLKKEEFEARHTNAQWFRALWNTGYWVREGASELPSGMSVQDYFVRRFDVHPYFCAYEGNVERFQKHGVPLETLRLTSIPPGMKWPPQAELATFPQHVIDRVLPRSAAQLSLAGVFESPWLLVAAAIAVFLLVSPKRRK